MSPHPRYNSRVLAFLSRQFGTWRDRTHVWARHAKMMGRWTAEAALFPFYRIIQTQKTLKQSVKKTVRSVIDKLKPARAKQSTLKSGCDSSTPILRVIEAIELVSTSKSEGLTSITIRVDHPRQGISALVHRGLSAFKKAQRFLLPSFKSSKPSARLSGKSGLIHETQAKKKASKGILGWFNRRTIQPVSSQALVSAPASALTNKSSRKMSHGKGGELAWVRQGVTLFRKVQQFLGLQSSSSHTLETPSQLTHSVQLIRSNNSPLKIQGIASLIESHAIVLVTPEQEILDILSPQQQSHLHQRVMQELSKFHAQRRQDRVFGKVTHLLSQFNPFKLRPSTPILPGKTAAIAQNNPPVWKKVKNWVFHSLVGALATLPIVAIPAIAAEDPSWPPAPIPNHEPAALWIDPNHLKAPIVDTIDGLIPHQTQGQQGLRTFPTQKQDTGHVLETTHSQSIQHARISHEDFHTEILVEAEFLGYEPHLLEKILGWLDAVMVQVEAIWTTIWTWIGIITLLSLSGIQKLRQMILG